MGKETISYKQDSLRNCQHKQCALNACMGFSFIWKQAISTAGEVLSFLYILLIWKQIFLWQSSESPIWGQWCPRSHIKSKSSCYQSFLKALGLGEAQVQLALVSADKVSKIFFSLFSAILVLGKMVLMRNALLWETKTIKAVRTAQDHAKPKSPCSLSQSDH